MSRELRQVVPPSVAKCSVTYPTFTDWQTCTHTFSNFITHIVSATQSATSRKQTSGGIPCPERRLKVPYWPLCSLRPCSLLSLTCFEEGFTNPSPRPRFRTIPAVLATPGSRVTSPKLGTFSNRFPSMPADPEAQRRRRARRQTNSRSRVPSLPDSDPHARNRAIRAFLERTRASQQQPPDPAPPTIRAGASSEPSFSHYHLREDIQAWYHRRRQEQAVELLACYLSGQPGETLTQPATSPQRTADLAIWIDSRRIRLDECIRLDQYRFEWMTRIYRPWGRMEWMGGLPVDSDDDE